MYNELELKIGEETKVIKFRLTSASAYALEEKSKKPITEFLQDESMTMIVTMLRYMRMWELPQFSTKDAQELYDSLIENGYTYKTVIQDVIYETLVCSGFLDKADWEEMKVQTEEAVKKLKEKQAQAIKNI